MKITIPGTPIPKMRHRTYLRGRSIQTVDPQSVEKNNTSILIRNAFQNNYDIKKYSAFRLNINFYFQYPEKYSKWIEPFHNRTPDYSNCLKFYEDCANEILYEDDKQIVEIHGKKLYSENPRTEIEIMPIEIPTLHEKVEKILRVFSPSDLEDILQDFNKLSYTYREIKDTGNASEYAQSLNDVATQLSAIAIKHTEKLSKLKKIGDIHTRTSPLDKA